MNFFRSLDTYILERFPILWHSKLLYLLAAGLVFWLGFYGAGYALTDLDLLKNSSMNDYFFESYAVLIHVILSIIILCFWALAFFKKNAVRHYYPLQRFYFTRLYTCIAAGFLVVFSAALPFQMGVRAKIQYLLPKEELQQDARTLNLALAFVKAGSDDALYYLSNRAYPNPFPLTVTYNPDPEYHSWETANYNYVDANGDTVTYDATAFPERTFRVGNHMGLYQLLRVKETTSRLNCYDETWYLVNGAYVPDSTERIFENDILNYSEVHYPGAYAPIGEYTFEVNDPYEEYRMDASYTAYFDNQYVNEFRKYYAPTIHRWVRNDRTDSIAAVIRAFRKVLEKHEIQHVIDENIAAKVLSAEQYYQVRSYMRTEMDHWSIKRTASYLDKINRDPGKFLEDLEHGVAYRMGFDEYDLDVLYENAGYGYKANYRYEMGSDYMYFIAILIVSLILALLFLLFDFTNFIQFLIAIPSAGVLMILTGFGAVLIEINTRGYSADEKYISLLVFLVTLAVLVLSVISVLSRGVNKKFAGVVLNVGYFAAPLLPVFFVLMMSFLTRTSVFNACGYEEYWEDYNFWAQLLENPLAVIPMCLAGSICYFALIKRWYAKVE